MVFGLVKWRTNTENGKFLGTWDNMWFSTLKMGISCLFKNLGFCPRPMSHPSDFSVQKKTCDKPTCYLQFFWTCVPLWHLSSHHFWALNMKTIALMPPPPKLRNIHYHHLLPLLVSSQFAQKYLEISTKVRISMDFCRFLMWISLDSHGFQQISMDFSFPKTSVGSVLRRQFLPRLLRAHVSHQAG
jgi:hypothetical protein